MLCVGLDDLWIFPVTGLPQLISGSICDIIFSYPLGLHVDLFKFVTLIILS